MRLPLSAHTIYQDLLEMHRLGAISAIGGTPFLKGHDSADRTFSANNVSDWRIVSGS
jgi:hypothetical protein